MKKTLTLALLGCLCAVPGAMGADGGFKWAPKAKGAPAEWQKAITKPAKKTPASRMAAGIDHELPAAESFGYLDMPDGSTWFITTELEKTLVSENEYYKEYNITGIKATVYDDKYQKVGLIEDSFTLAEGIEKCTEVQFGVTVTKKFFNTDDSYEIMLMANYKPVDQYSIISKTYVYSLRGADKAAEKVQEIDGYYVAAVNNATDAWSEDYFIEFFSGESYTETEMIYSFDIYTKASWGSPVASSLKHFDVDMLYVMSDGENETLPVMLNSKGRNLYVTVARYEKTFFEDPYDYNNNNLSADNHYLIELWAREGYAQDLTLKKTTSIKCETPADGFSMRSYCIGQFSGYEDITFDFTDDGNPAYIVSIADSDYQENSSNFFAVYDLEGNVIHTFGEDNGGFLRLSSIPGKSEQLCFIKIKPNGDVYYSFVDYPTMEETAQIPATIRDNEFSMTLSMALDRAPAGGSYNYVFADAHGVTDEAGNTLQPVAWFDSEGRLLRVDKINGGKDVNLIKPYIVGHALNPWLFNTDTRLEYMVLVQRQDYPGSAMAHTELCVINTDGDMLSQYVFPNDDSGISVSLVNLQANPAIWLSRRSFEDGLFHTEFISLPLNRLPGSGTEADPYLLATPGDMGQIKFNLTSHYRLANDIDYKGEPFVSISGQFTGSIDGASHSIKNFTLGDAPMFSALYGKEDAKVSVTDLTLSGVTVTGSANAILAESTSNTVLSGVHVYKATVESDSDDEFGTIVAQANSGTEISECSAVKTVINRPKSIEVGGIVAILGNNAHVKASNFEGSIKAESELGGIAGSARTANSTITDCHVNATLEAQNRIGGILAISARGLVSRCIVEGEIIATEPQNVWSDKVGGNKPMMSVGGVIGYLPAAAMSYEDGKPVEPSTDPVVKGCVVALDAITIPTDNPVLAETAHRIVGRSRVNNDPEIIDEVYNPSTYGYEYVWGEPAAPENCLADNYAVDDIAPIHGETAADLTSTEGKSIEWNALVDGEIFDNLAYQFNGYAAEQPWVYSDNGLPRLYFEAGVGASMAFNPSEISLNEGETAKVVLELENIEFDALTFDFSDESACTANPVFITDEGNVEIEVSVTKTGVYTVTATNGTISAVLTVTGTSGIGDVTVSTSALTYDGTTLKAADCAIALYNLSGILVASGNDTLSTVSLPAGVYMATATAADGTRSVLKIAVR